MTDNPDDLLDLLRDLVSEQRGIADAIRLPEDDSVLALRVKQMTLLKLMLQCGCDVPAEIKTALFSKSLDALNPRLL